MKRILCLIFMSLLFLTACSNDTRSTTDTKKYVHTPYVSSITQEECFVCGENGNAIVSSYWGEDNVAIVNLNTFEVLRIEINRYENGKLLEKKAGYMQSGGMHGEDTHVSAMTDPDRGYSHVQITGTKQPIDAKAIQSHLCQTCLDTINELHFGEFAPEEYAIISFSEKTIRPLIQNTTWFISGDFGIDCEFKENGNIDLLIHYCPVRYAD